MELMYLEIFGNFTLPSSDVQAQTQVGSWTICFCPSKNPAYILPALSSSLEKLSF